MECHSILRSWLAALKSCGRSGEARKFSESRDGFLRQKIGKDQLMEQELRTFGRLPDGSAVPIYTLTYQEGITVDIIPYGCRILRLLVVDRAGRLGDVILGHRTLEEYYGRDFHGCAVGRYANRIGGASFALGEKRYQLAKNDGENSLHGGPGGFHQILWDVKEYAPEAEEPYVIFSHTSPDGAEGFPGTLDVEIQYTLTKDDGLKISYRGRTDQETVFNPTNHAHFNLSGDHQRTILDTKLTLQASSITPVKEDLIPTGEILPVANTVFDFTKEKAIGTDMENRKDLYDHNFCVDGEGFRKFGEAYDPGSGRRMEVFSDMPGVQFYTLNNPKDMKNKNGHEMCPYSAFCLETQLYPDSPNKADFPWRSLKPGEDYCSETLYRFSVKG